jgi:hypothetical protein
MSERDGGGTGADNQRGSRPVRQPPDVPDAVSAARRGGARMARLYSWTRVRG